MTENSQNKFRRESDRRHTDRRHQVRRHDDLQLRVSWEQQRMQFITRYVLGALGLAYFNLGEPVARDAGYQLAVSSALLFYFVLVTVFFVQAYRHGPSPLRLRLAMWTDIIGTSFCVLSDMHPTSPAHLVYLVIILGNGMRYGMRAFAEAAIGSFAIALVIFFVRFSDYLNAISVTTVFFMLFIGIVALYAYSLLANIDKARRQLEYASASDLLTGLLNRRGLLERADLILGRATNEAQTTAVLFADLDGFKSVNDAHGHHVGDRVLKDIAQCIGACIRTTDVAARYGGDEFVILLPDTGVAEAAEVARRLQAGVAVLAREGKIEVSISIGLGEIPADGTDLEEVLQRVDTQMYEKKLGRNRGAGDAVEGQTLH